ncbi:MAG TPA: hypothetical protein VLS49_14090 [Usitatibacter sp.]|nr:hypothetical protein [Usitatibacter sp.]
MGSKRRLLALRKELLLARSTMLRLRAARDLQALREGLTLRGVATSFRESPRGRSVLLGALLLVLGSARLRRALHLAAIAVGVAKAVSALRRLRAQRPTSAASSQLPEGTS